MNTARLEGTRSIHKKQLYFYTQAINNLKIKLTIPFIIESKIKYIE